MELNISSCIWLVYLACLEKNLQLEFLIFTLVKVLNLDKICKYTDTFK